MNLGRQWGPGAALAAALLLCTAATTRPAAAEPGDGLRQGTLLLHPAVFLEVRYDSNLFRDSSRDQASAPLQTPMLRLLPELSVQTTRGGKGELKGLAQLDLRQYLNDQPQVGQQSNFGAHLALDGELGKGSAIGLVARQRFDYQPEPGAFAEYLSSIPTFDRFYNASSIGAAIHPGGGALEITPGYQLELERFPDYPEADRTNHAATLRGRWRFMPKTAIILRSSYGWRSFGNEDIPAANPLRAAIGLSGLVTPRLSVLLLGGYGNTLTDRGASFEGPIGSAGLTYKLTERMVASVGYERDFRDTVWSAYYDSHLFQGRWRQLIAGRWQVLAGAGYEIRLFSPLLVRTPGVAIHDQVMDSRTDGVFRADARVEWRPNDWLSASLGYLFEKRSTDAAARVSAPLSPVDPLNYAEYDKHQVFSKVGFIY